MFLLVHLDLYWTSAGIGESVQRAGHLFGRRHQTVQRKTFFWGATTHVSIKKAPHLHHKKLIIFIYIYKTAHLFLSIQEVSIYEYDFKFKTSYRKQNAYTRNIWNCEKDMQIYSKRIFSLLNLYRAYVKSQTYRL